MSRPRGRPLAIGALFLLALASPARAADAAARPGDAAAGEALFTGARRMQNGGAACGACHAIGGHGAALAASLGPELSQSFAGLPPEAVDGTLQDLPFPTMAPIFGAHPLTPQERADLAAFLVASTGAPPPRGERVASYAAAGAVALLGLLALGARRRKGSTRSRLRTHPPAPERPPLVGGRAAPAPDSRARRATASGGGTP